MGGLFEIKKYSPSDVLLSHLFNLVPCKFTSIVDASTHNFKLVEGNPSIVVSALDIGFNGTYAGCL